MHSIKHFSFLLTYFLLSMFLSACGAKGNLYQVTEPELDRTTMDSNRVKAAQENKSDTIKKLQ